MTELLNFASLPERFESVEHLEDFMSTPSQALVDDLRRLEGDIIILGVAGKMGVTLARLANPAAPTKRVVGVARFSDAQEKAKLQNWGVETITCDLLDREAVEALPRLPNVIFMAGRKFGTDGDQEMTWAMNALVPAFVAEAFKGSRIVAFSTIHVYPGVSVLHRGSLESAPPLARPGEYANSVVGRERMFRHFSKKYGTPGRISRLSYSIDMRYGALQEIANWVLKDEEIDLTTGHVNVIWQGDANSQILRCLNHCETPSAPINITGPEVVSVYDIALEFGRIMGKTPRFKGSEQDTIVVNGDLSAELFGYPTVPLRRMVKWVADWVTNEKPSIGKPSKFEVHTGKF
ncbi:NAD(P)-dependent oxidoreductase [Variovorax sp. J22P271]|uniref:NAD-dependent epimerase/dehydratase family protein n=1 Tax=Variovorax davisae TaxID=3053515 RepID=UPI002576E867|nr:NAD(P)-dependent oxidoreductase [Variovorax sp. J22P271]MDM0031993.1 NAD(P)-dependent oxidoreductase [Variovorax sp. J22P271]